MDRHLAYALHLALRFTWAVLPGRAKVAVYKRYRATRKPISFH
jgi:hypothetical protein